MAQQFIKPSVDDSVLEPDAMRGTMHYLTQEIRHPFTGETLERAEVVDLEQQRRDAMRDAIENKGPFVVNSPSVIGQNAQNFQTQYPANPDAVNPTPVSNVQPAYTENRDSAVTEENRQETELTNPPASDAETPVTP